MSAKVWVVYDSISKIQSQPISEEQLQMAILRMSEKDWSRFYLWTTGWESWQPLGTFLKSGQAKFLRVLKNIDSNLGDVTVKKTISENIDPELKRKNKKEKTITKSVTLIKTDEDTFFDFTQPSDDFKTYEFDDLKLEGTQPSAELDIKRLRSDVSYNKRAERHELKIEILLMAKNGKIFKSYSRNISLTGTILADNIPADFQGTSFEVVIINKYSSNLQKSRIHLKGSTVGEGVTQRMKFEFSSEDLKTRLSDLLQDYLKQQKQPIKSKSAS